MSKKTKEEIERGAREFGQRAHARRTVAAIESASIAAETEAIWEEELARWRADQTSSSDYDVN